MRSLLILVLSALSISALSISALPLATPSFAPNVEADARTLQKTAGEKRLIKTRPNAPAQWMTDAQILKLYQSKTHFIDLTYTPQAIKESSESELVPKVLAIPSTLTQQAVVNPIIAQANTDLMKSTLKTLTEFNNRYYRSSTGAASANWLFEKVKEVVAASGTKLTVTVTQFKHDWGQHSVIARIEGKNNNKETVVVGAHQDSINGRSPMSGRSPGADDDGSGTVSIIEAFRLLLSSGYAPLRPVEFMWYAGEEAGLLGSRAIAKAYKSQGRVVAGALQMDMTGYPTKSNPDVGIVTDYTNPQLNTFMRSLVVAYTPLKSKDFRCGYGCSDHASWSEFGFPSTFPFESSNMDENELIHSTQDAYDTVDFNHALQFSKMAVGFVVEMSHE